MQSYLIFRDYHPSVVQNIVLLQLKVLGYKIVAHPTPVVLIVNGTTKQAKQTLERNFKFRNLNVQTEAVQSLPCCRLCFVLVVMFLMTWWLLSLKKPL